MTMIVISESPASQSSVMASSRRSWKRSTFSPAFVVKCRHADRPFMGLRGDNHATLIGRQDNKASG